MGEFLKLLNVRDILLHMLNVAVLFVAVRLLLYKPVRKFMDARAERISAELADAAAKQEAADGRRAQLDEEEAMAREEAARALAEAVRQGAKTAGEMAERAGAEAADIIEEARKKAARYLSEAEADAASHAMEMAVEIAGALLRREVKPEDHGDIVERFLTKVG